MCPSSAPAPVAPRYSSPSAITPPPIPVPMVSMTTSVQPRPAPPACSARTSTLASLSTKAGIPRRSSMTAPKSISPSGRFTAIRARPVRRSIRQGIPKPAASTAPSACWPASCTASTARSIRPAWSSPERLRWRECPTRSSRSTTPASSFDPPMSTPMTRRDAMRSLYWCSVEAPHRGRGSQADAELDLSRLEPMPNDVRERPYRLYRSGPRGLKSLLRGQDPEDLPAAGGSGPRGPGGDRYGPRRDYGTRRRFWSRDAQAGPRRDYGTRRRFWSRGPQDTGPPGSQRITPRRVIKYLLVALVLWVGLSFVLFMISASNQAGTIPASAQAQLSSGGNMLFSANNILIIGTDQRPRSGPGSKEPGSNYNDAGSRSDTIMIWRVGGGTSQRLSIPRDTAVN